MKRDAIRSQVLFAMVPLWVLERCSSPAVHVYGFLMKYASRRDRRAWPKTETLAAEMGKSLRTVERAIAELRHVKALETTRRHRSDGAVTGLEFVLMQVDPDTLHSAISGGMVVAPNSAHPATGVAAIPPPVSEPYIGRTRTIEPDPRTEEREELAALPAPQPGHVFNGTEPDPTDPCERFRAAWNTAATGPLKPCSTLTPKRRRLIRAALTTYPLDTWVAIFARVNQSSFCKGEKGWVVTFDWLIATPDAAVKVLEGQYDNIERPPTKQELDQARQMLRMWGWCRHEPRCENHQACLARIIRDLRGSEAA